jgi:recombinational DNA repair ATPase RecF
MHLGSLTISRSRSCESVTVSLRPDLTVMVGENNGGKSNVVDAIRLLTLPLSGRRERYPEGGRYCAISCPRTREPDFLADVRRNMRTHLPVRVEGTRRDASGDRRNASDRRRNGLE